MDGCGINYTKHEPNEPTSFRKKAGGLRVKQLILSDNNGDIYTRKFLYDRFNDPLRSSGIIAGEPGSLHLTGKKPENNSPNFIYTQYSSSNEAAALRKGSVIYTNVEEYKCKSDINGQCLNGADSRDLVGRARITNSYFPVNAPDNSIPWSPSNQFPFIPCLKNEHKRTLQSKHEQFKVNGEIASSTNIFYNTLEIPENSITGAVVVPYQYYFSQANNQIDVQLYKSHVYSHNAELSRISFRSSVNSCDGDNIYSVEYFQYCSNPLLAGIPKQIISANTHIEPPLNGGNLVNQTAYLNQLDRQISKRLFVGDITIPSTVQQSDIHGYAIKIMKDNMLLSAPIEEIAYAQKAFSPLLIPLKRTIYLYIVLPNGKIVLERIVSRNVEISPSDHNNFISFNAQGIYDFTYQPGDFVQVFSDFDEYYRPLRTSVLEYLLDAGSTGYFRNLSSKLTTMKTGSYSSSESTLKSGTSIATRYTSFEDDYHGGWNFAGSSYAGTNGPPYAASGNKYYRLSGEQFNGQFNSTTSPGVSPGKYILSYWYKGALPKVYMSSGGDVLSTTETAWEEWTYVEQILEWTLAVPTTGSGNFLTFAPNTNDATETFVDELRLHPIDATMNTTGYYPDGKLMYKGSSGGDIVTYEYDSKGRLQWVLNKERKVIEYYEYEQKDPIDLNSFNKHTVYTTRRENITKNEVLSASINDHHIKKSVSYSDGFGRHRQSIDFNISSSNRERISFSEYDILGRKMKEYLPYYPTVDLGENDDYISNAKTAQQTYYGALNDPNEETNFAYIETKVESNPFQRPLEQSGVGIELHPSLSGGQGNTTTMTYGWNSTEPIRKWVYNHQTRQVSSAETYPAGHLSFVKTTDPNGIASWQWTDARGQKVAAMQEVRYETVDGEKIPVTIQAGGAIGTLHKVISYVVYDDFGRVVYEIPALAIERMGTNFAIYPSNQNDIIFSENITHYVYDKKGRVIEKYTPGQGLMSFVYNRYDELILSQDAQQRATNIWSFVKRDTRHRVVLKGQYSSVLDRVMHQNNADNAEWATKRVAPATGIFGYDNAASSAYPSTISAADVFNVYYFDDYNFERPSNFNNFNFAPFGENTSASTMLRGMPTGSLTRVFGHGANVEPLITVSYYDKKGRPIQAYTQNHTGGFDRVDSYYNELGQVEKTIQQHKYESNSDTHTFTTRFEYNAQDGSLKNTFCKLDNDPEVWVSSRWYDDSGKLKSLKLHKETGVSNFLQTLDYRYNAQGWLTHINNTALIVDPFNQENYDVFGQEIDYFGKSEEYSLSSTNQRVPQYNGNVSAMMWNAKGHEVDGTLTERHAYVYKYDELGRMHEGLYASDDPSSPGLFNQGLQLYDEKLTYDLGGNIRSLKRFHDGGTGLAMLTDNLTYEYTEGYRLKQVNDAANGNTSELYKHFLNGGSSTQDHYTYDQSGRTVQDFNRGVTFEYNPIGLPTKIVKSGSVPGPGMTSLLYHNTLYYTYDAAGNKLRKTIELPACPEGFITPCGKNAGTTTHTDYIGNFVYENGELKMIYHPEGVIRPTSEDATNTTEYVYDYFVKDYLGNVRVVVTEEDATYTESFLATLEEARIIAEQENFDNLPENQTPVPVNYPINGSSGLNEYVARIAADSEVAIGPAMLLRVQPSDRVQASVDYFYEADAPGTSYNHIGDFVQEVLLSMISAGSGILPLTETQLMSIANPAGANATALTSFFASQMNTSPESMQRPHAYLVWLSYNNNMTFRPQNSGARKVEDPDQLRTLLTNELAMTHNGYLHIYVSNGSSKGVNFNDFLITTARGKTRQINDYYPYGLAIAGIHSDENEYLNKYTSKELQTADFASALGTGLEMYDFHARFYDPQLGRWFTPDPAEQFSNPYLAMGNNPVVYVDPDGEFIGLAIGAALLITNSIRSGIQTKNAGSSFLDGFMYSFVTGSATMALTAGVGTAFGSVSSILGEVGRAGAHGLVGGGMSHLTGGDFKTGFATGAVSSLTGSLTHGMHPGIQTIASGLSGGFASTMTGGKFWNGFIQGATIAAVNHIAHAAFGPGDPPKPNPNPENTEGNNPLEYASAATDLGTTTAIGYNSLDNALKREWAYQLSKRTNVKAGAAYQTSKSLAKSSAKVLSKASGALAVGSVAYDFGTGTANTSTLVDAGMFIGGTAVVGIVGVAAVPFVVGAGVVYGVSTLFGFDDYLNSTFDTSSRLNFIDK